MSHSNRRGAAMAAAANQHVSLPDLAHRGQWALESFSKLMEYLSESWHGDQTVGRALSGWENPNLRVYSASLNAIASEPWEKSKVRSFVDKLFGVTMDRLVNRTFADAMTATLLMYLRDTLLVCEEHTLHTTLLEAGQTFLNLKVRVLYLKKMTKWGEQIRTKFIMDNLNQLNTSIILDNLSNEAVAAHFVGANTFAGALEKLVVGYRTLMSEILQLRNLVIELNGAVKSQNLQLNAIDSSIKEMAAIHERTGKTNCIALATSITNLPTFRQARSWPKSFTSLANIQYSDLIVRYLVESLGTISVERNNKVQHRVLQAIEIADKFHSIKSMAIQPPGRDPTEEEVQSWRLAAVEVQTKILGHIKAHREEKARSRGPTGSVEGVLKLWSKLGLSSTI